MGRPACEASYMFLRAKKLIVIPDYVIERTEVHRLQCKGQEIQELDIAEDTDQIQTHEINGSPA